MNTTTNNNNYPDIIKYCDNNNVILENTSSNESVYFLETKDTLSDIEYYGKFITDSINIFRSLKFYKGYKEHLYNSGLDHCQIMHNIDSNMADLEMNHVILTIFDIALLISEHYLNTIGYISTMILINQLRFVHSRNLVPLIMMSKTVHQIYHADDSFYVHPTQVYGKWIELLQTYSYGLTPEICYKVLFYLRKLNINELTQTNGLLQIANSLTDWSNLNGNRNIATRIETYNTGNNQFIGMSYH